MPAPAPIEREDPLAVVIAAYDEEQTAEALTRRLHATLSGLPGRAWEIVYVVEGRDRTREILERLARELGGIRVLYQEEPAGIGHAFRRGFAVVPQGTGWVVTMDADLNHQPEEIPRLLAAAQAAGSDVLVGSRFLKASRVDGTPLWKRFLSGTLNLLMRVLFGLRVKDKTSGFRVYRREALRSLEFDNDAFAFLPEILIRARRAGLVLAEEPIHFIFRKDGRSKMGIWDTSLSYLTLFAAARRSAARRSQLSPSAAVRRSERRSGESSSTARRTWPTKSSGDS